MIINERNRNKKYKQDFRNGSIQNFNISVKKKRKPKPKRRNIQVQSMRDFAIESNINFKKDKTVDDNLTQSLFKKVAPEEEYIEEPEPAEEVDFKIEPVYEEKPFGNDFDSPKKSSIKKYQYRQKIFEESQDIYYREVKQKGLINYKTLGSKFLKKEGSNGNGMFETIPIDDDYHELPKKYIKAEIE
jgi:hypothetical protein